MVKTNQNIINKQYKRSGDGVLVVCEEGQDIARKKKLLWVEFRQTDLPEADIVSGAHCLTVKHMDEEPVNNLKKGKAAMTYNRLNK